ncbi:MAG: succinylglutamate desuccinylase/aspartoacylase family protein [Myxococcales bacterium]|nr:succinylglutamate desuccinylase/aspartoacylase family protein [Myxococcales bacterium]
MKQPSSPLRVLSRPRSSEIGHDAVEMLELLGGPVCIVVPGRTAGRPRAITTLLHGNEPSGAIAIHRFLREGIEPLCELHLLVLSVEAALTPPRFSHRMRTGGADLNRCFGEEPAGAALPERALAAAVIEYLGALEPEAMVDLHNTSGRGPAYSVSTSRGPEQLALTRLFAQRMIHTGLRLGTIMEATERRFPTVTVECGGAGDPASHELAFEGLCRFARVEELFAETTGSSVVQVIGDPVRIELVDGAAVVYATQPVARAALTLPPDLDRHNFGVMRAGRAIGWLGSQGLSVLRAVGTEGNPALGDYFEARGGELVPTRDLEPLMVTTDPEIAKSDCLFYLVPYSPM